MSGSELAMERRALTNTWSNKSCGGVVGGEMWSDEVIN